MTWTAVTDTFWSGGSSGNRLPLPMQVAPETFEVSGKDYDKHEYKYFSFTFTG